MKLERVHVVLLLALFAVAGLGLATDTDMDGTPDVLDPCMLDPTSPFPNFCDSDMDGYGNACDADMKQDGTVGVPDFAVFSSAFGETGLPGFSEADMNCDGTVGMPDFPIYAEQFGGPPGPSGLACAGTIPCP